MIKISMLNLVIVLILLQSLSACNGYHSAVFDDDLNLITERRFPISPGNDLRIKVSGGDVSITSWDRDARHPVPPHTVSVVRIESLSD